MEELVTLQNVANIVTFIAPGYFLIQTYAIIYAKRERNISRLLIESTAFSLPLVAITNYIWEKRLHQPAATSLTTKYTLLLLLLSVAIGLTISFFRVRWPIRQLANLCGVGMPDEDFVRSQFSRLKDKKSPVTVTLKSGVVFSGTPNRGSIYAKGSPERYYFDNLAWSKPNGQWDVREGGVLVGLDEVEYIETPALKPDTSTDWDSFKRKLKTMWREWQAS